MDSVGRIGIAFTDSTQIDLTTESCTISGNDMQFLSMCKADYHDLSSTFTFNVAHTHITWASFFEISQGSTATLRNTIISDNDSSYSIGIIKAFGLNT